VRSRCTRAARGCPAGLPGRAQRALHTPFLTSPSRVPTMGGSGTQQSASGQAGRASQNRRGKPPGEPFPPRPQGSPRFPPAPPSFSPLLARPRSPVQAVTSRRGKQPADVNPVGSAFGLHLPRCARHTRAQAGSHPARNIRQPRPHRDPATHGPPFPVPRASTQPGLITPPGRSGVTPE
jgi:hypothetical protein